MLTWSRLREVLDYNPLTGVFTWRITLGARAQAGDVAGSIKPKGYRVIGIDRSLYFAHRLAWFYWHGDWPQYEIDHRNGKTDDNRLRNLRDCTKAVNIQNLAKARRDSVSGLIGASPKQGRWVSQIKANGKKHHLGYFDTPEEAHVAYLAAKARLHPEQPTLRKEYAHVDLRTDAEPG